MHKSRLQSAGSPSISNSLSPPARSALSTSAPSSGMSSLRDIMRQESQDSGNRKSSFSAGQRVSWKDVKKQQSKEAKEKQQQQHQQMTVQVQSGGDRQSAGSSPKAASNPW